MVGFKKDDENRFKNRNKVITFRNENCNIKGGKRYILMAERVSGGFGSAYFSEPITVDLRTIHSNIINAAGFQGLSYYMDETYNKKNTSYIRKLYFLKDIQLN